MKTTNRVATQPLLVLQLKGSQEQMGHQYGEIIREKGGWQKMLDYYPQMVERLIIGGIPRRIRNSIVTKIFNPLIELGLTALDGPRPEPYRKRMQAALQSAGVDKSQARYIQVMDVFQNSLGLLGHIGLMHKASKFRPQAIPACSSAVVWGDSSQDQELMHARNFDFPGVGIWDEAPVVVFCTPQEGIPYGYVATRGAELPGISAFNSEGLTVSFHTRLHKDVSFSGLGAVDLGHEMIRRAATIAEAIDIAEQSKIASTWGIIVSSAKERKAVVIETTAKATAVITAGNKNYLLNTNHYMSPELQQNEVTTSSGWIAHTHDRMRRMKQLIESQQQQNGTSLADLQMLLGDVFEIDALEKERSMGSILGNIASVTSMITKPESGLLSLSVGKAPTGWGPYADINLEWDSPVGCQEFSYEDLKLTHIKNNFNTTNKQQAYQSFQNAYLHEAAGASLEVVSHEIQSAVNSDNSDPVYHFLYGLLSLEKGDFSHGLTQLEAGLEFEKSPYRRGQYYLWAAKAAQVSGNKSLASAMTKELMAIDNVYLDSTKAEALKDIKGGVSKQKLQDICLNFVLLDAA